MSKESLEASIHYAAAFVGGCFGIYAITVRLSFGSAETMNLLSLVSDLLGHDARDFMIRLGALLLYSAGIIISELIIEKVVMWRNIIVSITDCAAIAVLFFLPADIDNMVGLYPIFFASAIQWCLIKGPYGYVSASIFSTNNLKQFLIGVVRKIEGREDGKVSHMRAYGLTLLSFHAGAAYGYYAVEHFRTKGIAAALLPLSLVLYLSLKEIRDRE